MGVYGGCDDFGVIIGSALGRCSLERPRSGTNLPHGRYGAGRSRRFNVPRPVKKRKRNIATNPLNVVKIPQRKSRGG